MVKMCYKDFVEGHCSRALVSTALISPWMYVFKDEAGFYSQQSQVQSFTA